MRKYVLYLTQKETKKKHTKFPPQKALIHLPFTLMKQPLMFFSDFPKKFASEREVFLLIFHLFHQQTAFFLPTMGPDLVFIRPC